MVKKKRGGKRTRRSAPLLLLLRVASIGAAIGLVVHQWLRRDGVIVVSQKSAVDAKKELVSMCSIPPRKCRRIVMDSWVSNEEREGLLSIYRGISTSPQLGGPTIFDLNSGYAMSPGGELINVYAGEENPYGPEDFELYRAIIRRLKKQVEDEFGDVYFTAPTFLARLSGLNQSWTPSTPHDEYWHPHVDKENTQHYDYSGLLYLSDYDSDFEGGEFEFLEGEVSTARIEPRRGRLLLFESIDRHQVRRVTNGVRYALSFWFTLDSKFEFSDYLDGQMHLRYDSHA